MSSRVTNIVIAGLGGQGVIRASDLLADVAFRSGVEVKKSEIHGMSQRGGSVSSDVRFGEQVFSPMVPEGEADYLLVLASDQVAVNRAALREGGLLFEPSQVADIRLPNKKCLNIALLGALSKHLPFPEETWIEVIEQSFSEKLRDDNVLAFKVGKESSLS